MNSKLTIIILLVLLAASLGYNLIGRTKSAPDQAVSETNETSRQLWTCGMHPNVILDHPGICPICEMKLVPLKSERDKGSSQIKIDPAMSQNIGVRTAPVMAEDLSRAISTNGKVTIDEAKTYTVNPRVSGWIEKLYVNETGTQVSKGQPLFDYYSPDLVAAQDEYLLALNLDRTAQASGVSSLVNSSRKLLDAARDRLTNWEYSAKQVERLEKSGKSSRLTTYYSPADGIVMHKSAVEGNNVMAGTELFQLADLRKVWIDADVYEYELPWISLGGSAMINSTFDPSLHKMGTVSYIYPYLNPGNRSAKIRIEIDNPKLDLKPEMFVSLSLDARTIPQALAIPREAVIRSGKHNIVFISKGDARFEPREIELGLEADGGTYQVLSGLSAGDIVVTSAQFLIDSERQLKEALDKLLAGGGSEMDIHKSMGHDHSSKGGVDEKSGNKSAELKEASGATMDHIFTKDSLYACPDHDHVATAEAATYCPLDNKTLELMTSDALSSLRNSDPHGCVMCPIVHPGPERDVRCAICNMKLKPILRTNS